MRMIIANLAKDPRHYQLVTLASLLSFGWFGRAFEIDAQQFLAITATACLVQALGSFLIATRPDFRSALITAFSLTLLLRADTALPLMAAAAIAVGSKFTLRLNDKHIFNPANIGIVAMLLASGAVWTTPGQWGAPIWFAFALTGVGFFVTYRSARFDTPLIFLGVFAALLFARALWLGDPLAIPLLRLQNGALLIFAFFMISDPKTTPDGAIARAVFATGAAIIAYILIQHLFISDGLFYALAAMSLTRPLLELADPAPRYLWGQAVSRPKLPDFIKRIRRRPPSTMPAE